jgi:hypothetical protein
MDAYEKIEVLIAAKYHKAGKMTRKAVGDFMMSDDHAVNVKSNNLAKQNYSPNIISIKKMHQWVFEQKKNISFVFVDYKVIGDDLHIVKETGLIPIENIGWRCLSIEAQGYGVIQKIGKLIVLRKQTKCEFYKGFLTAYEKFRKKENLKHEKFSRKFIKDPDSIDW